MKTFKELRFELDEAEGAALGSLHRPLPTFSDKAKKAFNYATSVAKTLGIRGTGIVGGALMPDYAREAPDADKPQNYPGEGLKSAPKIEPTTQVRTPTKVTSTGNTTELNNLAVQDHAPQIPKTIQKKPTIGTTKPAATKLLPSKKSLPKEDPNVGGGFVTAKAYGSKSAGVTSTQNVNKSPLDTVKLASQGSAERSSQMKKLGYKEF